MSVRKPSDCKNTRITEKGRWFFRNTRWLRLTARHWFNCNRFIDKVHRIRLQQLLHLIIMTILTCGKSHRNVNLSEAQLVIHSFIHSEYSHSFIPDIAPLQVHNYSESLPTTALILELDRCLASSQIYTSLSAWTVIKDICCVEPWIVLHGWPIEDMARWIQWVTSSWNIGTDWSPIVIICRWFRWSHNRPRWWVLPMYRSSSIWYCVGFNTQALQATVSEGLAQGFYVAARVGFEPAMHRTQGNKLTTEPPHRSHLVKSS